MADSTFPSFESFRRNVYSCLLEATENRELEFTQVPRPWARTLIQDLDEEAPSTRITYNARSDTLRIKVLTIDDSVQTWLIDELFYLTSGGNLTQAEVLRLQKSVGTTIELTQAPYRGSVKQPDFFFRPKKPTTNLPTLAVETSWSESNLRDDIDLLLVGGDPDIKAVILVKWSMLVNNRVSGFIELWKRDTQGVPHLAQREAIFLGQRCCLIATRQIF